MKSYLTLNQRAQSHSTTIPLQTQTKINLSSPISAISIGDSARTMRRKNIQKIQMPNYQSLEAKNQPTNDLIPLFHYQFSESLYATQQRRIKFQFIITNLAMIAIILALIITAYSQQALRTGIAQLNLGDLSYAAYNIVFSKTLPDSVYNTMISVSYVSDLAATNGIVINSVCPNTTQANMGCTINSNGNSQNNVVYMSYIASDVGSLLVGTYQHTFSFQNASSLSETLTFSPIVDNSYINSSNVLFVNFFPTVAGISTLDSDFSLSIVDSGFNALTMEISLNVAIKEMHAKNVTIYFGYLLFDASIITVSLYQGQRLSPDNIVDGYIYGISSVISQNSSARLLQSIPLSNSSKASSVPTIPSINPVSLYPVVVNKNIQPANTSNTSTPTKSKSTPPPASFPSSAASSLAPPTVPSAAPSIAKPTPSPSAFIPAQPSSKVQTLRSAPKKVILTPFSVNSNLFTSVMQPDGIIDANSTALNTLQQMGVVAAGASTVMQKVLQGLNNQLFNNMFSTNGFVILTAADDVDQIYYYEVDAIENGQRAPAAPSAPSAPSFLPPSTPSIVPFTPPPTPPTPTPSAAAIVFYRSVVTNVKPNIVCPKGVIVGYLQYVDYVQQKMVLKCMICQLGTYFDLIRKSCAAFPIINNYLNQYDIVI